MSLRNIILVNLLLVLVFNISCKSYKFYGSNIVLKNSIRVNKNWKKIRSYSLDKPSDLKKIINKYGVRESSIEMKKFIVLIAELNDTLERTLESATLLSKAYFLMADGTENKNTILFYSQKAIDSFNSLQWDKNPVAAYYYALGLGGVVRIKGLKALPLLPDVIKSMKAAIKKSDTDAYGPARIYGMLYLKAPKWPKGIGDIDEALKYLKLAAEKNPGFPQNAMFYAEALIEDDQMDEAEKYLKIAEKSIKRKKWGSFYTKIWKKEINKMEKRIN